MHLGNATDLIRGTIYGEHEGEQDGEQDGSMEAIGPDEFGRKVHRGNLLVAKKGPTHATSDDVDTDTKGNEEARLESSYN